MHSKSCLMPAALVLFAFVGLLNQPAGAASFQTNSPMADKRFNHTATLLSNGQVLVAGGIGDNGRQASAELFDPVSRHWTPTGAITTARRYHTATLLTNGMVLVAGGQNSNAVETASSDLYNPASGMWSSTDALDGGRYLHTATLLPDGRVLVAGGIGGGSHLASAELFDPASNTWTPTGSLNEGRYGHTATLLPNGKVLVSGGLYIAGSMVSRSSQELYDPSNGMWALTGPLVTARDSHTATLLNSGKVLIAGGFGSSRLSSAELYDPATGTNTLTGSMNSARDRHTATLLPNGLVLAFGETGNSGTIASAELYNPDAGVWMGTGSLKTGRSSHTACLLPGGLVLVAGGEGNAGPLKSTELYDYLEAIVLRHFIMLPNGTFQFDFTNTPGAPFSVLATTDLLTSRSNWNVLGGVTETSPGHFQFGDPQPVSGGRHYYSVRSP